MMANLKLLFVLGIFFVCGLGERTTAFASFNKTMRGSENLNWIKQMKHEHDIPFSVSSERDQAAQSPRSAKGSSRRKSHELSRLGMLVEMGLKHPAVNCENDCTAVFDQRKCLRHCQENSGASCPQACEKAQEAKAVACQLGLVGATYYLTQFQEITGRSNQLIWHGPNASLNIEAYAYMKEMEKGLSCEQSLFISRFPTRRPSPGESAPPIQRVEVCQAWIDYFRAAGHGIKRQRVSFVEGYDSQSGLTYENWLEQIQKVQQETSHIQSLMWRAHTLAILHAYWQHLHEFKRSRQMEIPREEYRMWMGWNKLVGGLIPDMNLNSCAGNAEFLAYQLMPNCVVGERTPSGKICQGTSEPGASFFGSIKSEIFHQMQTDRASEDFIEAIEAFSTPMEEFRKIPYVWPWNTYEPFSFNRGTR